MMVMRGVGNAGGRAAHAAGRGIRRLYNYARREPREAGIRTATAVGGIAGAIVGYHLPEVGANVLTYAADAPAIAGAAISNATHGASTLTSGGLYQMSRVAHYPVDAIVNGYQGVKFGIDLGAGALGAAFASGTAYHYASRLLRRPPPPAPLAPPQPQVIHIHF